MKFHSYFKAFCDWPFFSYETLNQFQNDLTTISLHLPDVFQLMYSRFKSVPFATTIWNLYSASYFHNLWVISNASFQDLVHQLANLQVFCNMLWLHSYSKWSILVLYISQTLHHWQFLPEIIGCQHWVPTELPLRIAPWNYCTFKQVHLPYYISLQVISATLVWRGINRFFKMSWWRSRQYQEQLERRCQLGLIECNSFAAVSPSSNYPAAHGRQL